MKEFALFQILILGVFIHCIVIVCVLGGVEKQIKHLSKKKNIKKSSVAPQSEGDHCHH